MDALFEKYPFREKYHWYFGIPVIILVVIWIGLSIGLTIAFGGDTDKSALPISFLPPGYIIFSWKQGANTDSRRINLALIVIDCFLAVSGLIVVSVFLFITSLYFTAASTLGFWLIVFPFLGGFMIYDVYLKLDEDAPEKTGGCAFCPDDECGKRFFWALDNVIGPFFGAAVWLIFWIIPFLAL